MMIYEFKLSLRSNVDTYMKLYEEGIFMMGVLAACVGWWVGGRAGVQWT
jgi:hypothetical protein